MNQSIRKTPKASARSPLVTVIVATYNNVSTIEACLRSIKAQTYRNIELLVVDNSSTDTTPNIAKRFADRFFSAGPERSAQRNYGAQKSKGSHLLIIDSDMELSPNVVANCISEVTRNSSVGSIIVPEESFGNGFWAQCKRLERSFYIGVDAIEAARFFDKNLYLQLGGYNERLISGEDWDLSRRARDIASSRRINDLIYHNEGHLKLWTTLRKKYRYAKLATTFFEANPTNSVLTDQSGPVERYKLFFSQPRRLLRNPLISIGMLFMKTCEFGVGGVGYIRGRQTVSA